MEPTIVLDGQCYRCPALSAAALNQKLHGPGAGAVDFDPATNTWTLHGDGAAWQRVLAHPLVPVYDETLVAGPDGRGVTGADDFGPGI